MPAHTYRAAVTNIVQGIYNPAIVDFTLLDAGPTDAQKVAGIVAYFEGLGQANILAPNTILQGVTKTPAGGGPGTPMPFPVAEYTTIQAANPAILTFVTAFPDPLPGGGGYEALGTSLTVSLYSATPGRKTTGRHYVPWISTLTNTGNGTASAITVQNVTDLYRGYIMGETIGGVNGVVDLKPMVFSATAGLTTITTPICSTNYARLKTRTR